MHKSVVWREPAAIAEWSFERVNMVPGHIVKTRGLVALSGAFRWFSLP